MQRFHPRRRPTLAGIELDRSGNGVWGYQTQYEIQAFPFARNTESESGMGLGLHRS